MSKIEQHPSAEIGAAAILGRALEMHGDGTLYKPIVLSFDAEGRPQLMYASMSAAELAILTIAADQLLGIAVMRTISR